MQFLPFRGLSIWSSVWGLEEWRWANQQPMIVAQLCMVHLNVLEVTEGNEGNPRGCDMYMSLTLPLTCSASTQWTPNASVIKYDPKSQ